MKKKYYLLLLALVSSICLMAQGSTKGPTKAANEAYQKGEQQLLKRNYKAAIRSFDQALRIKPGFVQAIRLAGVCHELLSQQEQALGRYFKVLELDPYFSRTLYYEIGRIYYRLGSYREALDYFSQFAGLQKLDSKYYGIGVEREREKELRYIAELSQSMLACEIAIDSIQFLNVHEVINLGPAINTQADEYFPFVSNDQALMFYTQRKNEAHDENLFVSEASAGIWDSGQPLNKVNSGLNEGMSTFIRNGRKMYFTSCDMEKVIKEDWLDSSEKGKQVKRINCDIQTALLEGKKITKKTSIQDHPNSDFWESQAAISCDGQVLYFASNRAGGYGGTDIWKTELQADDTWSKPVNLGPNINTAEDEEAPFITNDGRMLYFSSTGHFGLGEEDIYFSRLNNSDRWTKAINLGAPVNSSDRELGFFLSADGKTGYYASNRAGGYGGMDIYKFELSAQLTSNPITFVEGYVKDSQVKLPVPCTIEFEDRIPIKTDLKGRFFVCFPANERLRFTIEETGFRPYTGIFDIPFWENQTFYKLDIELDPNITGTDAYKIQIDTLESIAPSLPESKPRLVNKINMISLYYNNNESKLTSKNKTELDKFLKRLTDENIVKVEIIGYADYIGSDAYNLKLSEERAKSVAKFLKERSIVVDKVYLEGKGEVKDEKDTSENRRVEIIVTSKVAMGGT